AVPAGGVAGHRGDGARAGRRDSLCADPGRRGHQRRARGPAVRGAAAGERRQGPRRQAAMTSLRGNRDFLLLQAGQLGSTLGSMSASVAYPLLVLATTRSPLLAGVVGVAR